MIDFAVPTEHSDPSWFAFQMTINESAPFSRAEIVTYLEKSGIQTRPLFAGNITRQPCLEDVEYRIVGDLPVTDRFMERSLLVGCYPGLSQEQLDHIVECVLEFAS